MGVSSLNERRVRIVLIWEGMCSLILALALSSTRELNDFGTFAGCILAIKIFPASL